MNIFNRVLENNFRFIYYDNKLEITNYIDIPIIDEKKIVVSNKYYILNVVGNNLSICKLSKDELLINGLITSIGIDKINE